MNNFADEEIIPFILKIFLNWLLNVLIGKKYLVRVNGTWSVARGKKGKWGTLYILYGRDLHYWALDEENWTNISTIWSEQRIEDEIVQRNIQDLIIKHPKRHDYPRRKIKMPIRWDTNVTFTENDG